MIRFYIILLLLTGCQHSRSASELAEAGDCEAAFNEIPWETSQVKFAENSKQVAGTAASYAATGLGYLTDAFVFVGEGAYKTIVYCPYATVALATAIAMKANMQHLVFCGKDQVKIAGSRFGQKIYYRTSNLRKTDFNKISEINRSVASCYVKKGGHENRQLAREKLEPLATDSDFLRNISSEERDKLLEAYKLCSQ
jgi:hypothetical protein